MTELQQLVCADSSALTSFWQEIDHSDENAYNLAVDTFFQQSSLQVILDNVRDLHENEDDLDMQLPIGYVYAAWNPVFADLIKIGATMRRTPYIRLKELSGTGVPEPFQLIAYIPSKTPFALEREIHSHFNSVRKYGRKKEFFTISRSEIVEHFHIRSMNLMLKPEDDFRMFEAQMSEVIRQSNPMAIWMITYDSSSPTITHQMLRYNGVKPDEIYSLEKLGWKYSLINIKKRARMENLDACMRKLKASHGLLLKEMDDTHQAIMGYYSTKKELVDHKGFKLIIHNMASVHRWHREDDADKGLLWIYNPDVDPMQLTKPQLIKLVNEYKKRKSEDNEETQELVQAELAELRVTKRKLEDENRRLASKVSALRALYHAAR